MSNRHVMKRDQNSGQFVEYDKSGAVSVRVLDFLRSDTGQHQLKIAKELRSRSPNQSRVVADKK